MHMKTKNNPHKNSDTELQCIFPVLQCITQKKCYVRMLTSSQILYLEYKNYYTKTLEYEVIFWTLKFRVLSYYLDNSLTDW